MDRYIIQAPDHRLYKPSNEIVDYRLAEKVVKRMLDIAFAIRNTIYEYPRGFEMAAPQIGEFYKIIILQGDYRPDPIDIETTVIVNPEILEETDFFYNWEDCLSVKDMRGYLKRCGRVRVRYRELNGKIYEKEFQGNIACDIQHGVDHLKGKLFFDREMKYFIPLSVYRPLKDQGIEALNEYVTAHYHVFDPNQYLSPSEMEKNGLIHPRQCLLKISEIYSKKL